MSVNCRSFHSLPYVSCALRLRQLRLVARLADRRQQDADQQRDDRDHHQQLDDGESTGAMNLSHGSFLS
jgi:hypothetical protein